MKIEKLKDKIIIKEPIDFNISDTLDCGQVFSYNKFDNKYFVVSSNKIAKVYLNNNDIIIETKDVDYFFNYFDLKTDYQNIKNNIVKIYPDFDKFLKIGCGIRILKQDEIQTIISFIVSSNNNIKRIKGILFKLCEQFGDKIDENNYAFPNLSQLLQVKKEDFDKMGAGYRSSYLVETIKSLNTKEFEIETLKKLSTSQLKEKLLKLKGVGPKVADCILLFGFKRSDVFPIDTWMRKSYYLFETKKLSDKKIAEYFTNKFGIYSGYAQQYIFNSMINGDFFV